MKLKQILKNIKYSLIQSGQENYEDIEIHDIKYDSRKVCENDLYVALVGSNVDAHDFIPEAILKKASVIVVSKMVIVHENVTVIKVDDTRIALAYLANNFFEQPQDKLTIIGITGTSGKTTCAHMIYNMLNKASIKCAMIGSIGIKYLDKQIQTSNTTPESYEIYSYFKKFSDNNITHVVMETSSQAFKMHRLDNITFDIGVLTNITSDHIGPHEHLNQEEYINCKRQLFLNSKKIIINQDSLYLNELLNNINTNKLTYAIKQVSDLMASDIKLLNKRDILGLSFQTKGLINESFQLNIPGIFNVYNALACILVGNILGLNSKKIKEYLKDIEVRGRMQTAYVSDKFKIIIDYAHTKDAMNSLIATIKEYHPKRLVTIFGSGGNRSKERRYNLGMIMGSASDLCILTMDNPRFEEISSINQDIKLGLNKVNAKYIEIDDRSMAIAYAIKNAQVGDIILLVGKGHEEYQDIKGTKYYFNEMDVIKAYLT